MRKPTLLIEATLAAATCIVFWSSRFNLSVVSLLFLFVMLNRHFSG